MNFTSLEFLLFFPLVLALYWRFPFRWRWGFLLFASYCFYLSWNIWTGFLLAGTTLVSWYAAKALNRTAEPGRKRLWLAIGTGGPLACLLVFKYADFLTQTGAHLLTCFGLPVTVPVWNQLLPVGISFYTFQTLSYVIDVYRGDIAPESHLGYYALFVSFFPQLVAGPIERPDRLLPQLRTQQYRTREDQWAGLLLLLRGFFKKVAVADYLAQFADPIFQNPETADGPGVVLAVVCFALQIYGDFSGYSDIALGTARLMGIRLMENFFRPYGAESIRDFWRRWHISLTSWFTDYLYKPLGGSRRGVVRHCLNLMLVFLVSGLWHGANWTFLIWGGIHGLYLVCGTLAGRWKLSLLARIPGRLGTWIRRGWVFALTCFAWVFFRANSVTDALTLLSHLGRGWNLSHLEGYCAQLGFTGVDLVRLFLSLLCLQRLEQPSFIGAPAISDNQTGRQAMTVFFLFLLITVSWLTLLATGGDNVFLYFQF